MTSFMTVGSSAPSSKLTAWSMYIKNTILTPLYSFRSLEKTVRECMIHGHRDKVTTIIEQLCHDYAYAVNQPHARNGGLIGLAAASIALGSVGFPLNAILFGPLDHVLNCSFQEVAGYLDQIVPPVLACFADQDARVRYYACESMYNIAKVAKGEILPFFNEVFDALSKVGGSKFS
jgi:hypothetical protein